MSSKSPINNPLVEGHSAFTVQRKIRFGQTDPAGIVYYPNYFDMFNEIVEDWFSDELGVSFRELHEDAGLGVPIAHVDCQFKKPCRMGDQFTLQLTVVKLGATSLHLQVSGSVGSIACIAASMVLVFVDLNSYLPTNPPEALRARIERWIPSGDERPIGV
jgi:4-hydroxybenzoyl-CoA thioesterase